MVGPFLCVLLALAADGTDLPREPVLADGPVLNVSGTVLDHTGAPVANADVTLRIKGSGVSNFTLRKHNLIAQTTTNAQGEFRFDHVGIPPRHCFFMEQLHWGRDAVVVIVRAPEKALAWSDIDSYAPKPLRMTLSPAADVNGTVFDEKDRPLAGARVRLHVATRRTTEIDLGFGEHGDLNLITSPLPIETTSDQEGRFHMPHVPAGMRVMLEVTAPKRARQILMVETGDDASLTEVQFEGRRNERHSLLRSPLKISLLPQTTVTVRIVDHEGKPVSSGTMRARRANHSYAAWGDLTAQGEVHIPIATGEKISFFYGGAPGTPHLSTSASLVGDPQQVKEPILLTLPKPRWLTGRVVDAAGQGVSGVYVSYATKGSSDAAPPRSSLAVSHDDGNFRIPVVPGPGTLEIAEPVYRFFTPRREDAAKLAISVDIAETGETDPVTLRIHRGLILEGVVRDADQRPVAGAKIRMESTDRYAYPLTITTDAQGGYRITGLSPHASVKITVTDKAGYAFAQFPADAAHDLTSEKRATHDLTLKPGVTLIGRVVQEGQPQSGVRIRVSKLREDDGNAYHHFDDVTSDANGEFRVYGFPEGDSFYVSAEERDERGTVSWKNRSDYTDKAGQGPEFRLPDAELTSARQRLRGIVVDPQGAPLAGITVAAKLESGEFLPQRNGRPAPWIETDENGLFDLTHLPDLPLQLMAHKRNPAGGRIRFPSVVSTKLNQADIRIILDPELNQEIESLDPPMPK